MYPRHILPRLRDALADTPVVLVNGARQTGKSTLVKGVASERGLRYLTLDDRVVLSAAAGDPVGFIEALSDPVVIDEVQRVPELLLVIKAAVDRDRRPGRFLLTGSANVMMLPAVADSLAGRMEVISLLALSSAELAGHADFNRVEWLFEDPLQSVTLPPCDRDELAARLLAGGFPEAVARVSAARRAAWFESYLQAILQRDVRELARIEQLAELPHLLELLAARSANLLNFAEVSRALGLSQTTLKRYFALLEMLFLVERLPAWDRNRGKRLVKSPKVFLRDTGLLAHLRGTSAEAVKAAAGLPGALVEGFVLDELRKHLAFSTRGMRLYHYRTQAGAEVDFVLESRAGDRLTGIEVKASATLGPADFKALRHLKETEPAFARGIVFYAGREFVPFAPDLFAVPLSMWWAPVPG